MDDDVEMFHRLPPGVYFNPGHHESVQTYLSRRIAGEEMPDVQGIIFHDDVYGVSPDVLGQRHPPANTRDPDDPKWWFFSDCKMQATRWKTGPRGRRLVATGGYWKLEQSKKNLSAGGEVVGYRRSFGFHHVVAGEDIKTRWLMEEYTTRASLEGLGNNTALPALYKMYVSPRAPDSDKKNKKKRAISDGEPVRPPARVMVPTAYFDAVAALLPPASVRGVGQGQLQEAPQPPPPGVVGHHQGQFLQDAPPPGVFGLHQGQFLQAAPPLPPPPPPGVVDHHQWQFLQEAPPLPPPAGVVGHHQGQFLQATATPPPPPPPPPPCFFYPFEEQCLEVASDASSYEHGDEYDAMLGEMGSPGGDFEVPAWMMMDADHFADIDMSWIDYPGDTN